MEFLRLPEIEPIPIRREYKRHATKKGPFPQGVCALFGGVLVLHAYYVSNKQRTKHHILAPWSLPMIGHGPFSDETGVWSHDEQKIIDGNGT